MLISACVLLASIDKWKSCMYRSHTSCMQLGPVVLKVKVQDAVEERMIANFMIG